MNNLNLYGNPQILANHQPFRICLNRPQKINRMHKIIYSDNFAEPRHPKKLSYGNAAVYIKSWNNIPPNVMNSKLKPFLKSHLLYS